MCAGVVAGGVGSVVESDDRNLRTGGPRGVGRTGTARGPAVDQSTGLFLVLLGRSVALLAWKGGHFNGGGEKPAIKREKRGGKGMFGEGTRERVQTSIGKTLFVYGFADVSVDFEHNTRDFWRRLVKSRKSRAIPSDSREPEKRLRGREEGDLERKKGENEVGREEEYRLQRAVGASGGVFVGQAKVGGEEAGRRGRRGRLRPRLRRAAALLSGRRGGWRANSRARGSGVARRGGPQLTNINSGGDQSCLSCCVYCTYSDSAAAMSASHTTPGPSTGLASGGVPTEAS